MNHSDRRERDRCSAPSVNEYSQVAEATLVLLAQTDQARLVTSVRSEAQPLQEFVRALDVISVLRRDQQMDVDGVAFWQAYVEP